MFIDNVVKYLVEKSTLQLCREEIVEAVDLLVKNLGDSMSYVNSSLGRLLKIQAGVNKQEVFEKIDRITVYEE